MKHIFLDSTPLSAICNPVSSETTSAVRTQLLTLLAFGHKIYVPEIIDYELRRELTRAGKTASLAILGSLKSGFRYVPITTEAMLLVAALWADARNAGTPTGDPKKLDIDAILAAQALVEGRQQGVAEGEVVVATSNVAHLSRFVQAELWTALTP